MKSGLALLLVPFFFACDDPSDLGLELESDNNPLQLHKFETVIPASTLYIDSLRTEHFTTSLFGRYQDPVFGEVTATSYHSYSVASGTLPGDTLDYSDVFLILKIKEAKADGIVGNERIEVRECNEQIHSDVKYFASNSLEQKDEVIATHDFTYDPLGDTIINVPLSEAYGTWLFDLLVKGSDTGDNQDSLLQNKYDYPPLAFNPGSGNAALYSIDLDDDTTGIYVEMTNGSGALEYFQWDLKNEHFASLERDRSGTPLSVFNSDYQEEVLNEQAYLNLLSGVYTQLDLAPYLEFAESHQQIIINRASLRLAFEEGENSPVDFIQFYYPNSSGRINGGAVVNGSLVNNVLLSEGAYRPGSSNVSALTLGLATDSVSYEADITLFTQILSDNSDNEDDYLAEKLVITSPETIGLGQTTFIKSDIKLTVYYATVENN
ncbi:DUF4270 family protein [Marinoscillum furvescens]|uniref:Uncharacterized protein DUF4270 n=1 Tax=Marinoscillum furvescens DSM 4134 TaxID=1122208 RepID=A0A3D9LJ58_MARFU|nr:DUF4270 family protein [Marinoscillum furvescens]REE05843.1 uncharacterized protein DUF4270 [Marinoscillum furvescens DSM 4134]